MKKLVNIQSNWFIGNEYRVHHVPDNSIILRATLKNPRREVLFYEYDFNFEKGIRRGLLFKDTGERKHINSNNIDFGPYSYTAHSDQPKYFTVNSDYKALNNSDSKLVLQSIITISDTEWIIIGGEDMADDTTLLTLLKINKC